MEMDRPLFSILPNQRQCEAQDLLLCFQGNEVLVRSDAAGFCVPTAKDVLPQLAGMPLPTYLFQTETQAVYGMELPGDLIPAEIPGCAFQPVACFREMASRRDSFVLITAYHMMAWMLNHQCCGFCGQPMLPSTTERALCCSGCGKIIYPVISPAVSVAITCNDRLLLVRNTRGSFQHFTLVAGYVEVGENLEETVVREVMEEVGLKVKNLRYVGSQPWGFSQSLMMGFHAEVDGGDQIVLQASELSDGRWFSREEIEPRPHSLSLSFRMIEMFRSGVLP